MLNNYDNVPKEEPMDSLIVDRETEYDDDDLFAHPDYIILPKNK